MKRDDEGFGAGAARVGWLVLLGLLLLALLGIATSFTTGEYIAGGAGATVVAVGIALGAEYGAKHPDGGRSENRRR
jgi:hypothetical protein